MRIGMMVDLYKPHVSGITNYISLNRHYLEKSGHEVFVFTFGDLEFADDEVNIFRSPGLPLTDTGYYLSFRYSRRAKAMLQTMDLVHVHHPFLSGRLALRYCRPMRIPVVFTNHTRYDLYAQTYLPLLPEELSETFLQTYMPSFCAAVDMVISPSAGMAKVLQKLGVLTDIAVIPNGVDLERYKQVCDDCRSEYGFKPDDIILVYSGRLAPEKSLDFLLTAFAGVAEAVENTHLLLVGGGSEEESLRQMAAQSNVADRIHFTGMLPYDDLPRLLAMCDIFVTASVTEVHPLSVIEAMATGLPTLGIHSVGVGDIVEDENSGFLSCNDLAAFSAKLTRLCLDKPLRREMGVAARRLSEKYSITQTTKVMLAEYERLVFDGHKRKRGLRYRLRSAVERFPRMTNQKQALGRWGEDTATRYLQEHGFIILERNLRTPHGEIDILASKDDVLTFVEVKMRSSNAFGFPEDAVSPRKQAHMLMAAEYYFERHQEGPETWQFDIIAITRQKDGPPEIEHFENIIG